MKKQDIERKYTEEVAHLLNQGWLVHTSTMPGHQGEVAHIDLTDGSEIRRVLLTRGSSWDRAYPTGHFEDYDPDRHPYTGDTVAITVGRNNEPVWPGWDSTIWNGRLEKISEIEFAEIQSPDRRHPQGWFTDMAEADRIAELRHSRRAARREAKPENLPDAYKSVALRWIRKQPRMKNTRLEDITWMSADRTEDGRRSYQIEAKGKRYTLRA